MGILWELLVDMGDWTAKLFADTGVVAEPPTDELLNAGTGGSWTRRSGDLAFIGIGCADSQMDGA